MSAVFNRLVEVTLPHGGHAVAVAEAYFDESGTHDGSPVMCVAGYIFEADAAKAFSTAWNAVLRDYDLPYFHMKEITGPSGVFAHLTKDECDECARKLIPLIREHMTIGVAAMVDRSAFGLLMPEHPIFADDYHYCALRTLVVLQAGLKEKAADFEKIAYFFESGHGSESALGHVIYGLMGLPDWKEWFKYSSHGFVAKVDAPPVQAADMFAWHFAKSHKCWVEDRPIRKDYLALVGNDQRHRVSFDGQEQLIETVALHLEMGMWGELQGFSDLRPPMPAILENR